MQENGCKKLWVSLLSAVFLIVLTVALSAHDKRYAALPGDVSPARGGSFRIDAAIEAIDFQSRWIDLSLCGGGACLRARAPLEMAPRIGQGRKVIAQGAFVGDIFHIESVLTRCR